MHLALLCGWCSHSTIIFGLIFTDFYMHVDSVAIEVGQSPYTISIAYHLKYHIFFVRNICIKSMLNSRLYFLDSIKRAVLDVVYYVLRYEFRTQLSVIIGIQNLHTCMLLHKYYNLSHVTRTSQSDFLLPITWWRGTMGLATNITNSWFTFPHFVLYVVLDCLEFNGSLHIFLCFKHYSQSKFFCLLNPYNVLLGNCLIKEVKIQ